MQNEILLVETALTTAFVAKNSDVYVKIGNNYVRKKARDLQKGDLVIVNNEGINKRLEDIIPILEQSMRYSVAKETLHKANAEGKEIKKFRILLLEGLADKSTQNLEKKIMQEYGYDFSEKEYSMFKDRVLGYGVNVKDDAVIEWLKGTTLAPRDWNNFSCLIPLDTEFQSIADSYGKDSGYYAAYQLFTGLRRTIMSYIAKRTGAPNNLAEKPHKYYSDIPGKYRKEIGMVVGHFMEEVDNTKSATRITKIKPIEVGEADKEEGREIYSGGSEPHLKKGVFTGELGLPLQDINQIREELGILDNTLHNALNLYVFNKLKVQIKKEEIKNLEMVARQPTLSVYLFTKLVRIAPAEKSVFKTDFKALSVYYKDSDELYKMLNRYYSIFLDELCKGQVDSTLGIETNTTANLIDLVNQYRSGMPKAYFELKDISIQKNISETLHEHLLNEYHLKDALGFKSRDERKELERRINSLGKQAEGLGKRYYLLEKYLEETYSLKQDDKHFFIPPHPTELIEESIKERGMETTYRELSEVKENLRREGAVFYKKNEVENILNKLGVGSAINLFGPEVFI